MAMPDPSDAEADPAAGSAEMPTASISSESIEIKDIRESHYAGQSRTEKQQEDMRRERMKSREDLGLVQALTSEIGEFSRLDADHQQREMTAEERVRVLKSYTEMEEDAIQETEGRRCVWFSLTVVNLSKIDVEECRFQVRIPNPKPQP